MYIHMYNMYIYIYIYIYILYSDVHEWINDIPTVPIAGAVADARGRPSNFKPGDVGPDSPSFEQRATFEVEKKRRFRDPRCSP